jgi:hypothetical protein
VSDWYGTSRSNYFRVKDIGDFRELCSLWGVEFIQQTERIKGIETTSPDLVGFTCNGGLPDHHSDVSEGTENEHSFDDFLQELSGLLKEDEVAVMVETGAEKQCYVTGFAIAVNSRGEQVSVSLDSIYELAKPLGKNMTKAEY